MIVKDSSSMPHFKYLSDDQIQGVHDTVLRVLGEIGVEIHNDEALGLLRSAGAAIDGRRARIPSRLVAESLASAPHRLDFYTRDGDPAMELRDRNVYFGTIGTQMYIYDPFTQERRPVKKADIAGAARVCDYLPYIDWVMPMGVPSDFPPDISDIHGFHAVLCHQTKPIYSSAYTLEGLVAIVEMCSIVAGGDEGLRRAPFFFTGIDPISPLVYADIPLQKLLFMAEKGLPFTVNCGAMAGATAPSTLAGTLIIAAAEGLCALVISQLKRPGTPVIIGGFFTTMDMSTTVNAYGAPELSMLMAAFADLTRFYGIPMFSTGGCSNSKTVDQQAAIESALSILVTAQSGANLVHDVSLIDTAMTTSLDSLVMCNEIIAMVRRLMEGVEVSEETLAFDIIRRVGPGGHYLADDHTLEHFRRHHRSKLLDRDNYDTWKVRTGLTMGERMSGEVRRILEEHEPTPLPDEVRGELGKVLRTSGPEG